MEEDENDEADQKAEPVVEEESLPPAIPPAKNIKAMALQWTTVVPPVTLTVSQYSTLYKNKPKGSRCQEIYHSLKDKISDRKILGEFWLEVGEEEFVRILSDEDGKLLNSSKAKKLLAARRAAAVAAAEAVNNP